MNFYKRYPADYGRKTSRLTLAQHGAYTLLLDELYATEQPLPAELAELHRICRAMSKREQDAVRIVADQFFPIGEDGLRHNRRATAELVEAAPAVEAARANGKKGGRPAKVKPTGLFKSNPDVTQDEPRTKAPHSSDNSTSLRSVEPRASRLPQPFELPSEWEVFAKAERPDLDAQRVAERFADFWHAKPGKDGRKLDWFATFRNWVRAERVSPNAVPMTFRERDEANASARVREMTGGLVDTKPTTRQNDALQKVFDAIPARRLG